MGKIPSKEDLAQWLSQALKQALSIPNITKAFQCTGIFPLDPKAMDSKMTPSIVFDNVSGRPPQRSSPQEQFYELPEWEIKEIFDEEEVPVEFCQHYYVEVEGDEEEATDIEGGVSNHSDAEDAHQEKKENGDQFSFTGLLKLPRVELPPTTKAGVEARIDYQRSIVLTAEDHMQHLQQLATKKADAVQERINQKLAKAVLKEKKVQEKKEK